MKLFCIYLCFDNFFMILWQNRVEYDFDKDKIANLWA